MKCKQGADNFIGVVARVLEVTQSSKSWGNFNVAYVMGILSSSVLILAEALQFPEACMLSCFGVTRWLALLHITKCCTFWCYTIAVLQA